MRRWVEPNGQSHQQSLSCPGWLRPVTSSVSLEPSQAPHLLVKACSPVALLHAGYESILDPSNFHKGAVAGWEKPFVMEYTYAFTLRIWEMYGGDRPDLKTETVHSVFEAETVLGCGDLTFHPKLILHPTTLLLDVHDFFEKLYEGFCLKRPA